MSKYLLKINKRKWDKVEYGLFDDEIIEKVNIDAQISPGNTPIEIANRWHRDLIHLTVEKASNLVKAIFGNLEKKRLDREEIQNMILRAFRDNRINLSRVNKSMRKLLVS
jgi:hypothetical protein